MTASVQLKEPLSQYARTDSRPDRFDSMFLAYVEFISRPCLKMRRCYVWSMIGKLPKGAKVLVLCIPLSVSLVFMAAASPIVSSISVISLYTFEVTCKAGPSSLISPINFGSPHDFINLDGGSHVADAHLSPDSLHFSYSSRIASRMGYRMGHCRHLCTKLRSRSEQPLF